MLSSKDILYVNEVVVNRLQGDGKLHGTGWIDFFIGQNRFTKTWIEYITIHNPATCAHNLLFLCLYINISRPIITINIYININSFDSRLTECFNSQRTFVLLNPVVLYRLGLPNVSICQHDPNVVS